MSEAKEDRSGREDEPPRCSIEALEARVAGGLSDREVGQLEAHLASCAGCRDDLAWLKTEALLMTRRRERQPPPALWSAIERRLSTPPAAPVRGGSNLALAGILTAAAAAAVLALWPAQRHLISRELRDPSAAATLVAARHEQPAAQALDRAEREYHDAVRQLEAEYRQERAQLPPSVAATYDRSLDQTRTHIAAARTMAGGDLYGRMQVLDGYAEYVRSLQTLVSDLR